MRPLALEYQMSLEKLFTPVTINTLEIPNRIAMAPMTRLFSPGGVSTPEMAQYYRRRAEGGVGLIITEGTGIDRPVPTYDVNVPDFFGEEALAAWKHVVEEVPAAGGLVAPQLWHAGAARHPFTNEQLPGLIDTPSGLFMPDDPTDPTEPPMTEKAIEETIAAFGQAAADSKRLGFDALELHGAHGYLIDQFFWKETNLRADAYGGQTIEGRVRFGVEVIRAVRAAVGPDYPVILRISQWKGQNYGARNANSAEELERWLQPLSEAGVDSFHCSQRRFWEPEFEGSDLNLAGWARKITGKPSITVGSVGLSGEYLSSLNEGESSSPASLDGLIERLERDEFDMVAVGRALLHDPQWVAKIRDGREDELMPYDPASAQTLY